MNLNILFKDFPKVCRLCLSSGELQSMLQTEVRNIFSTLTHIEVEEDDKLPENVCNNCVKQLEDISTFINKCKQNHEVLRTVMLNEFEKNFAEEQCLNDDNVFFGDDDDDVKSECAADGSEGNYLLVDIKEEIVAEVDVPNALNKYDCPVSCENCSENFPNREALEDHYNEIVNCCPKEFRVTTSSVPNIVDFLHKGKRKEGKRTKSRARSIDTVNEEPEYVKGRLLKGKRRFLCSYCGKNYTRKNGLDRHMLSHTGDKPFECEECGKRYITKDTLKTHFLTHTGIRAHKCGVCGKSFTQSSHLSYHMRRHSGDKPYSCTFCGKGFLSNYHLERHKLMHTGVKPFQCKQCGKQFVRGTTLRDHTLIHTGEKPFQCQHCGKQFNRKQALTNHVLVHTGGQVRNSGSSGGSLSRALTSEFALNAHLMYNEPNPINSGY